MKKMTQLGHNTPIELKGRPTTYTEVMSDLPQLEPHTDASTMYRKLNNPRPM